MGVTVADGVLVVYDTDKDKIRLRGPGLIRSRMVMIVFAGVSGHP
jgi:hypothetical protein